jgi:hypothetical protein
MKIAARAQAHGLDTCPHGDQQTHLQCSRRFPNSRLLEYYPRQVKHMASASLLNPPEMTDHGTVASQRPHPGQRHDKTARTPRKRCVTAVAGGPKARPLAVVVHVGCDRPWESVSYVLVTPALS